MLFIKHLSSAAIALFGHNGVPVALGNKTAECVQIWRLSSPDQQTPLTAGSGVTGGRSLYLTPPDSNWFCYRLEGPSGADHVGIQ